MSKTQFVSYRDQGFWAYDVALAVFLRHLIDVAESRAIVPDDEWLAKPISWWRIVAGIGDYSLEIDDWTPGQIDVFSDLANQACTLLEQRTSINAEEIESWPILDDLRICARTTTEVSTAPIVELGRAIVALVNGSLPSAPDDTVWFYGTPSGRTTLPRRQ